MTNKRKGKLELDWVDKGDIILTKFDENGKTYPASYFQGQVSDEELMPRELELVESVGDPKSENMLIWGENLIALRSLENEFAGRIKLIYIDPPFNTGQDFEDYEDGLEHSIWLSMMENRLRLAEKLLSDEGFICIHIDENETAYLKSLANEIFGKDNHLTTFYIQVRYPTKTLKEDMIFHKLIEQIHIYRKSNKAIVQRVEEEYSFERFNWYIQTDEPHETIVLGGKKVEMFKEGSYKIFKGQPSQDGLKEIWASGTILDGTSSGRFFRDYLSKRNEIDEYKVLYKVYGIGDDKLDYRYFTGPKRKGAIRGKYYQGVPLEKTKKGAKSKAIVTNFYNFAANFGNCRHEGGVGLKSGKKPEILLREIISPFSKPSDHVLDFFAGSGTTGAVAHKMGRKWIMVEIREDMIKEKALKRMKNVIKGEQTGISKEVGWKGGGGFKFDKLGEPLIVKHKDYSSIKIINPKYYNTALIKVICNLEGVKFRKDDKVFHGVNKLGNKYAHITEQYVSQGYIDFLKSKLADNEEMIIYCFSYDEKIVLPFNMIIKKLPTDLGKAYQLRLGL